MPSAVGVVCKSAILFPGEKTARSTIKYETSARCLKGAFGASLHPYASGEGLASAMKHADAEPVSSVTVRVAVAGLRSRNELDT